MFGLFKRKSKLEKLEAKHEKLLQEAYQLSRSNRTQSDLKQAEAAAVLKEIEKLNKA